MRVIPHERIRQMQRYESEFQGRAPQKVVEVAETGWWLLCLFLALCVVSLAATVGQIVVGYVAGWM